jgi:D-tyrosyl-tRNA(Tyr) deacylase
LRTVIQRVSKAGVSVAGETVSRIGAGLCILAGFSPSDTERECAWAADKIVNLRIFDDEAGVMNRSLLDAGGSALVVSQFTLYADCKKGRRPSYSGAAKGEEANALYEKFAEALRAKGADIRTGVFGADMTVDIINEGPVTIILDSAVDMPQNIQGVPK